MPFLDVLFMRVLTEAFQSYDIFCAYCVTNSNEAAAPSDIASAPRMIVLVPALLGGKK